MRRPGATTIAQVDTDYPDRPAHRGHTVEIDGWNSDYVLLLIVSDGRTHEAIISPQQLRNLADKAAQEVHRR